MIKDGNQENMAEVARQRSNIYGLLAAIYREEVTPALLRHLRDPQFRGALSGLGVDLEDEFFRLPEEKFIEDLALEYTRLFLGPGRHISPHESVHLREEEGGGLLWGEATVKIKRFIESSGLEYKSDYHGMPDHISVELEFMQQLTKREAKAWGDNDPASVPCCLKIEKGFMDEHFLRWIPLFCEKVIKDAELPFYREVAKLTNGFLEFEKQEIEISSNSLPLNADRFASDSRGIPLTGTPFLNAH